ncbi:NAD(P)-dependent oxidoreductase [Rathayibacter sp. VKM Ac-2760]|uniref:NAD-dependent epimerase/dehydratase family protein n=1 Tax=Rathayibacter sp. VKM Ac-2760 TaxID=2609253 RepID=UPI0013184F78|nr:NAD(P)-dependent oxidoreductase [Rathayibacter sp. VKM Ac-2760]QHC57813.1 NAD-dependent epimerase/dehydratase family protein [Rathayibacter sp. VKM Ac-2760]
MVRRLLMTGGSGMVASLIRPILADAGWSVALLDLVEPRDALRSSETFVSGSITDLEVLTTASRGVDVVVHLGGFAQERPWPDILSTNIDGTRTVLEAARSAGVMKLLLASSIHAVGYATAAQTLSAVELAPCPDSYYGVSKAAMEALGRLYADRFGMTVVSARFGTTEALPSNPRSLSVWLSPGDLCRLIEATATTAHPGGHVVWGTSANTRGWLNREAGQRIGYRPQDDAEQWAASLGSPDPLPSTDRVGGGVIDNALGEAW